jgi:nitrogen fixation NifU-like protein
MDEEKLIKYFMEAKDICSMENPDAVGIGGDPGCTDYIKLYLKIDDNDTITDAKAEVFGCHVAIAATSAFLQLIKNKNFRSAINVKPNDVLQELGGLPNEKIHCTSLGPIALENAINDYILSKLAQSV